MESPEVFAARLHRCSDMMERSRAVQVRAARRADAYAQANEDAAKTMLNLAEKATDKQEGDRLRVLADRLQHLANVERGEPPYLAARRSGHGGAQ